MGTNDFRNEKTELNYENAALIIIGAKLQEPLPMFGSNISGVRFSISNVETGEKFNNVSGIDGFPDQTVYAMWLAPGVYTLSDVFFYNGSMHPIDIGPRTSVSVGDVLYVGTISTSWHFPTNEFSGANLVDIYNYSRTETCLFSKSCETDGKVYVLDDKKAAIDALQTFYPEIQPSIVITKLLSRQND